MNAANVFTPDSDLVRRVIASPNHGVRRAGGGIDLIVLHYTGCPSAESALLWMCSPESQVSAHYLVDEDGEIVQLVPEARRAWHAGASFWDGETDVNSRSIGIEIHNPGHAGEGLPPYPKAQIDAVIALCADIMARHGIAAHRVVGHSDVAPMRKADPGEHFPWRRLAAAGVALAVEPAPARENAAAGAEPTLWPDDAGPAVRALRADLAAVGYGLEITDVYDEQTEAVVRAFQRRFRPDRVDGLADAETRAILRRVLAALQGGRTGA